MEEPAVRTSAVFIEFTQNLIPALPLLRADVTVARVVMPGAAVGAQRFVILPAGWVPRLGGQPVGVPAVWPVAT